MQKEKVTSYKDLIVWQKGVRLAVASYHLTSTLPKSELFGSTSQIRRSATSVSANIAEGYGRGTKKEYAHFLKVARGSLYELQTHIIVLQQLPHGVELDYNDVTVLMDEVGKMLTVMIRRLTSNP